MLVVKIGGAAGINYDNFLSDLAKQNKFLLVHGGKEELRILSENLGKPAKWVTSATGFVSRYTDKETMEMFKMAYCGKMNKMIVEKLQSFGVNAVGLSGIDGQIAMAKRKPSIKIVENGKVKILHDDYTGKIEKINTNLLELLLNSGFTPVVTPPALSYEYESLNVDGDRFASMLAQSFKSDTLIMFSNVAGLYKDFNDSTTLIKTIKKDGLESFMQFAQGTMKKKLMGAKEALDGGVKKIIIASANVENPISSALAGNGTVIE